MAREGFRAGLLDFLALGLRVEPGSEAFRLQNDRHAVVDVGDGRRGCLGQQRAQGMIRNLDSCLFWK